MHFSQELLVKLWFLFILINLSKFSSLWFLFILIKLCVMLWHSTANCKVSKFSHYWSDLDLGHAVVHCSFHALFSGTTGLILINLCFCLCCGILQPIVKFQNFLTFLHFSQELLVIWSWSKLWFLFRNAGLDQTLTANCKVLKVSHFFTFFSGTTGLILIKLWFLFMPKHSAVNCKVSKFCSLLHFSQELLVWSWSNFDFYLCCDTLQANCKVLKVSQFFAFFSGTTGLILIKLWFLFMPKHSAVNCKVSKFCSLLHFSQELLVWSWSNFDFCSCFVTLQPIVKFQNFFTFFIFLKN